MLSFSGTKVGIYLLHIVCLSYFKTNLILEAFCLTWFGLLFYIKVYEEWLLISLREGPGCAGKQNSWMCQVMAGLFG